MAAENFAACLAVVLREEGGYSNVAADNGHATNLGVTQATWQHWVGPNRIVTTADIKALTVADVTPLYQKAFWAAIHADLLPVGVDLVAFDYAVNSGPGHAARALQTVLGVPSDGLIGPATLTACIDGNHAAIIANLSAERLTFLRSLPEWSDFGGSWGARVERVEAAAKAMLPA